MNNYPNRRRFLGTTIGTGASLSIPFKSTAKETKKKHSSETLVAQLYNSLTEKQKNDICFDFNHNLRSEVNNNWHITKPRLGKSYTPEQQALVKEIFMGLHSDQYAKAVYNQVVHDSGQAGFGDSSIALLLEQLT